MIALWLWCALAIGWAEEVRIGLFVGNNYGAAEMDPLLFAESDATKIRDLFVAYGGLTASNSPVILGANRRRVLAAFQAIQQRIQVARDGGDRTVLVFYYSGHGDAEGLHLDGTLLPHTELNQLLESAGADVSIGLLDACHSGHAIRRKGGQLGPSYAFELQAEATQGTAVLTSSAASEVSQESTDLGGGFFTHYLHTALTGAADRNSDGEVTLTETYAYVHTETAFRTRDTPDTQTPSYDFDLSGAGDITLTTLERTSAWLVFPGSMEGTFAVWDDTRKRYVAELPGVAGRPLAVRPGSYVVQRRMLGWVDEAEYRIRPGDAITVDATHLERRSYEDTSSKGHIDKQIRRAKLPDLALRASLGSRGFGANSEWNQRYLPAHPIGGFDLRFLRRSGAWYGADFLTGGGAGTLNFPQSPRDVNVQSYSLSASAGWSTKPRIVRAGIGGRVEAIQWVRSFPSGEAPTQGTFSVAPGAAHWVGLHYRRLTLDIQLNLMMLPLRWDERSQRPIFGESLLTVGYRF